MAPQSMRGGGSARRGELRLLVEGAFSAPQICDLADRWGLPRDPRWDRSAADASHGLLREAERRFGLLELVRRLQIERPLLEWPDLSSESIAEWGPPSGRPREPGPPGTDEATLVDAPPTHPEPTQFGVPIDAPPPNAAPAAAPPPPTSEPMRLYATTPTAQRQTVDLRVAMAAVALLVFIVAGAFAAGLLWSRRTDRPSDTRAGAGTKASGPAHVASEIFSDALFEVADRCDMVVDGPPTKDVLAAVQTECGEAPAPHHRRSHADDLPDTTDVTTTRPTRRPPERDPSDVPTPEPRVPARSGCVTSCRREHDGCVAGCGGEPSDASQYGGWQSCTGRCLSAESRCRLACR